MKYRNLRQGEIVRKGDEYYASDQIKWRKVTKQSIGLKVIKDNYEALITGHPCMSFIFRRRK